ncbi:MAG: isoaspartyl peptidase/L-asparaginase, partial [Lysobacter sp.]|nr:isoaspartyl peptidase/L-asparaginase [Lysobacter sp.]
MTIALIAHGGAGRWRPGSDDDATEGLRDAVEAGRAILAGGGRALDAVCATVVMLEDNPIFNAGTGAVLNFDGFCELDACVMESREARVGAVCGLQRVRNPVLVARKVMEETDHV